MGEISRSSNRPASPGLQERAVKAGWLKKQRSIMKNWQLRWFVLRTDQLYFYKDEEETKPQGCIPLQGSQVNELPANPEEPGKHLFEIVPGQRLDTNRRHHPPCNAKEPVSSAFVVYRISSHRQGAESITAV
ncbi:UNVERIFIED_CONTAM: hypothetical protein FKN15_070095 [Acipenser sinensis]